jgi:hypothetical protein
MLRSIIQPKTQSGRFFYMSLIAYLVMGISGCTNVPRTEKPATSIARAMETRSFPGDLKSVLKAAINSLQDMDYTIEVLNSDIGLITASRTTEHAKAGLANEKPEGELSAGQKACLAIGAVAVIAIIVSMIFGVDGSDGSNDSRPLLGGNHGHDDGPDGPKIYRYKVTINLTELVNGETNVRVSASGEIEQDGKILSTGGVHEMEFFQKFFAGMSQGLFLDQNAPINN